MKITELNSLQRAFIATVLSSARTNESADALGRAIAVRATATADLQDYDELLRYIKDTFIPEVDEYINNISELLPVNVKRTRKSAIRWMKQRLSVASGLVTQHTYYEGNELSSLGLSDFIPTPSVKAATEEANIMLFNGYSDLIAK